MERAAEPTDVYWENISIKTKQRVVNILITYSVTLLILCLSFGFNYLVAVVKYELENRTKGPSEESYFILITLISIVGSSIVSLVNFLLNKIVRYLTLYERHETYTKYNLSVAIKLVLAMFANTALIPFVVNYSTENWFIRSGLVSDVFFNTLAI
jgi:hypothetical protein